MILKRVRVRNFRAVKDATVEFGAQTAILGANGTGKSTILRAIERFYATASAVELDDFYGRHTDQPIEIALTFARFSDDERERFGERIRNEEMTVTRVFEGGGGRSNGRYYGSSAQCPLFRDIRTADGARAQTEAFHALIEAHPELGLQRVRRAAEIEPQLAHWEEQHPGECELMRDDGQFFGFSNVGRGNLQRSTSFVFIPAVRDASADALDARGAVIARLMELVVRSAIQRRAEVRDFQARVSAEYSELVSPERMPELAELTGTLTATLKHFYADAGVDLQWRAPEELSIPLPTAEVSLEEDGFAGPVDRKGHGLQRAFIVTLLQHLAKASAEDAASQQDASEGGDERAEGPAAPYVLPGLILAIEEPELYQHPTKQRHFARVLARLSEGVLPGVAAQTQVMFASHSALFVSLDRFDQVRLARRHIDGPDGEKECKLTYSSLAAVARKLEAATGREPGTFTPESLRPRLHVIGPELAEGFFADLAVIVEGADDKAALLAAAALEGLDFEAQGIAVLPADGKNNMDRPIAIFDELGIPLYAVWDCDQVDERVPPGETNAALQRLMGNAEPSPPATTVTARYAHFQNKLEVTLRSEIGEAMFDRHLDEVREEYGLPRVKVLKVPSAVAEVLRRCSVDGGRSATLSTMVQAIFAARK